MKRKTKNFIEDTLILIAFFVIVYLVYLFIFKEESSDISQNNVNDNTQTTTTINNNLNQNTINDQQNEKNIFSYLYEEIKKKVSPNEEPNNIQKNSSLEVQPSQPIINPYIHPTRDTQPTNNIEEEPKEEYSFNSDSPDSRNSINHESAISNEIKHQEPITNEIHTIEEIPNSNEIKDETMDRVNRINEKASLLESTPTYTPHNQNLKEEKQETIQQPITPLEEIKTDENSEDKPSLSINEFLKNFEKKVRNNINKNINKLSLESGEFVNIRVTILKSGEFEQLTFLGGNPIYFNTIKKYIENIFPLKIPKELKNHFPRYYRIKIDF